MECRKCVELRRGKIYDVQGVKTLAVVESTIRGIRVVYSGEFEGKVEGAERKDLVKKVGAGIELVGLGTSKLHCI